MHICNFLTISLFSSGSFFLKVGQKNRDPLECSFLSQRRGHFFRGNLLFFFDTLLPSFMDKIDSNSSVSSSSESLELSFPSTSNSLKTLSPLLNLTLFFGFLSGDLSSPRVLADACFDPSSINFVFKNSIRNSFLSSSEPFVISSDMVLFISIPVPSSSSVPSAASLANMAFALLLAHSLTNSL